MYALVGKATGSRHMVVVLSLCVILSALNAEK